MNSNKMKYRCCHFAQILLLCQQISIYIIPNTHAKYIWVLFHDSHDMYIFIWWFGNIFQCKKEPLMFGWQLTYHYCVIGCSIQMYLLECSTYVTIYYRTYQIDLTIVNNFWTKNQNDIKSTKKLNSFNIFFYFQRQIVLFVTKMNFSSWFEWAKLMLSNSFEVDLLTSYQSNMFSMCKNCVAMFYFWW